MQWRKTGSKACYLGLTSCHKRHAPRGWEATLQVCWAIIERAFFNMPDYCGICGRRLRGKGVCKYCDPMGTKGYDIVEHFPSGVKMLFNDKHKRGKRIFGWSPIVSFEKLNKIKGAKFGPDGFLVDSGYMCPYCGRKVKSLVAHLKQSHM